MIAFICSECFWQLEVVSYSYVFGHAVLWCFELSIFTLLMNSYHIFLLRRHVIVVSTMSDLLSANDSFDKNEVIIDVLGKFSCLNSSSVGELGAQAVKGELYVVFCEPQRTVRLHELAEHWSPIRVGLICLSIPTPYSIGCRFGSELPIAFTAVILLIS